MIAEINQLLFNSTIGMFSLLCLNTVLQIWASFWLTVMNCPPLFTAMWWIQISLSKQVIVFVAMTVNIICQLYCVIVSPDSYVRPSGLRYTTKTIHVVDDNLMRWMASKHM